VDEETSQAIIFIVSVMLNSFDSFVWFKSDTLRP